MIHGLGKGFSHLGKSHILHNWTLGCIAVTNEEIAEIYSSVEVGTMIEIRP
jgi:lipoprotein-anchoring transpeptidase ErfK/SrfK